MRRGRTRTGSGDQALVLRGVLELSVPETTVLRQTPSADSGLCSLPLAAVTASPSGFRS